MARHGPLVRDEQTLTIINDMLQHKPDTATLDLDELRDYHHHLDLCNQELNYLMRRYRSLLPFHRALGLAQLNLVREAERIITEIRRRELAGLTRRRITGTAIKKKSTMTAKSKKNKLSRLSPPQATWVGRHSDVMVSEFHAPNTAPLAFSTPPARPQEAHRLPWAVLGSTIRTTAELQSYLRVYLEQRKRKPPRYDMERIDILLRLRPTTVYLGKEEFDGYLVLYFAQYNMAVLECPIVGNALYLIRGDWQALARRSKAELLHDESGKIQRIIHHGAWTERLTMILTTPGDVQEARAPDRTRRSG